MKKILLLNLLVLVTSLAMAQQRIDEKKLQQYIAIQRERLGFSGTILIAKNGNLIANHNTGMASIELGVPISDKTVFPVASISKSFTASLVLLAVAEQKLNLSDSLAQFFPQLSDPQWRRITIDQLLSHRSGIPHNEGIPEYWTGKSTIAFARVPAMKEIFSLKLESNPGTKANYSSPGYFVLASVLENLYGKSYGMLLREKMVMPLKLAHTGQLDHSTIVPGLAEGYLQNADELVKAPYRSYSLMKGSGDLYASAADLIDFLNSFDRKFWPISLEKEMFALHSLQQVERGDMYGYGWFIRKKSPDHPKAFYHGGGSFGVSALMARYPEEKLSIVILSNVSVLPVNQIWSDIEHIVFGKPFELPIIKPSLSISLKTIASVTGSYKAANGMELQIFTAPNKLYAKMGNNPAFEIFQESPQKFYGKKVAIDVIFELDANGIAQSINATGMGQQFQFNRK